MTTRARRASLSAYGLSAAILITAAGFMLASASTPAAAGDNLVTLYGFCAQNPNCADGSTSYAQPLEDASGNIFVTTTMGGANGQGVLMEIPAGGTATTLYNFCSQPDCLDGAYPVGNLIEDKKGNLYGVTENGGPQPDDAGVVFELARNGAGWTYQVLYSFCSNEACDDGATPLNGLTYVGRESGKLYDGKSPLYGTTGRGGAVYSGVAFELVKKGKKYKQTLLYTFCSQSGCTDGEAPQSTPIVDSKGNIFGTTAIGGNANGDGVFYELSPGKKKYRETVLYTFCQQQNCADGFAPNGPLAIDSSGALYGTTYVGGARNSGVVYKLVPDGTKSTETVLYSFCPGGGNCVDGRYPGGVTMDGAGNLYGTTGGGGNGGVTFEFSGAQESVLYAFCQVQDCADGGIPQAGVVLDGAGNILGATSFGGPNNEGGTVFELTAAQRKRR